MVMGLPIFKALSSVCDDCMIGKQHRETLSKKSLWRASKKLQLVHRGICGHISPKSNSGKRYVITFIDYRSRKTWVYFMSEKSEALYIFKYKLIVKREGGERISYLRIDRGGEFTSSKLNNFYSMELIENLPQPIPHNIMGLLRGRIAP